MGHSITDFHGAAFTAKDWKVQVWLHLLVRAIDRLPEKPDWLCSAREYWYEQATIAVNGLVCPNLDRFLHDDSSVAVLRKLVEQGFSEFRQFGEKVPCAYLNEICQLTAHNQYVQDIPTESFLAYGRALQKLLDGKMKTHEYA